MLELRSGAPLVSGLNWHKAKQRSSRSVIHFAALGPSKVAAKTTWRSVYGRLDKQQRRERDQQLVDEARRRRRPEQP